MKMSKPDTGIHGITIEQLNGLRKRFDCYYSHIFMGIYGIEKMNHKLISMLLCSVTENEHLPPKEDVLKWQEAFEEEAKLMGFISEYAKKNTK
jgi:hypothetical protein